MNRGDLTVYDILHDGISCFNDDCYVDCLTPQKVVIMLGAKPRYSRYITSVLNDKYSTCYDKQSKLNGYANAFSAIDKNNPVTKIEMKTNYNSTSNITYQIMMRLTIRIDILIGSKSRLNNIRLLDIGTILFKQLYFIFESIDDDVETIPFNQLFNYCMIGEAYCIGNIDLSDLPEKDGYKYMKLLSCARRYRYMKPIVYNDIKKCVDMQGRGVKITIADGNTMIDNIHYNETTKSTDEYDDYRYHEDKLIVIYSVSESFLRNRIKINTDSFNEEEFARVMKYIYTSFTDFITFSYTDCDFYNATNGCNAVNLSSYHADTRDDICRYIRHYARFKEPVESGQAFKDFFNVEYSNGYSNMLKKFKHIGISPIVIPNLFNIEKYKNPLVYMYLSKHPEYK